MDHSTGRRLCELIAGIIATDGHLHPAELDYMLKTFTAFGITTTQDDVALSPAVTKEAALRAFGQLPEGVRDEAVQLLIQSAAADGEISVEERDYLDAITEAAGVSGAELERRLESALARRRSSQGQ